VLLLLAIGILGVTVGAYADFLLPTHAWEVGITVTGSVPDRSSLFESYFVPLLSSLR
jgi:hypothetical protein